MTAFKDHFSGHARAYTLYRPTYPDRMFAHLASLCARRGHAWDCGTGGGQAAIRLAAYFERVTATDAAAAQIEQAVAREGVTYAVAPAEASGLPDASVDLINVAQAAHWFQHDAFYDEVRRVAAPGCILALSCYGLFQVSDAVDAVVSSFYAEMGPWWPPERDHIDTGYAGLPFPFPAIEMPSFHLEATWDLDHLIGYLGTWSAVQRYMKDRGEDPLPYLAEALARVWGGKPTEAQTVRWPIHFKAARLG